MIDATLIDQTIENALLQEFDRVRNLPLQYREDARAAIRHALASHLVDCMLRQGQREALMRAGAYEISIRPAAQAPISLPIPMRLHAGSSQAEIDTAYAEAA